MEFALQVGPALVCTMRGMRKSPTRLLAKMLLMEEKDKGRLEEIKKIADDPDFNPRSAEQLSHFLYKTLGAKPPTSALRKMKSKKKQGVLPVDEPTLKQVRLQHPILDWVIDKITDYKKAAKNVSNFGSLKYPSSGRLMYALNAGGTETHRFSCRKHVFDYGTQVQNITSRIRDFIIADEGYVIFEPDFGQSDMWFVAKESGDEQLQYN